jgi:hypothetical protein
MNRRVYLSITVLLVLLTLGLSEAGNRYPGVGPPMGPYQVSVIIPAEYGPSVAQRMILADSSGLPNPANTRGKISENESPRPQNRTTFPNQDTNQQRIPGKTQTNGQGSIFDRWGK